MLSDKTLIKKNYVKNGLIQINGIDLSLNKVFSFSTCGKVKKEKTLTPYLQEIKISNNGFYYLDQGVYLFSINEKISLDLETTALVFPRSSLIRCGVSMSDAVWDAGFRSTIATKFLVNINNPKGFIIEKGARFCQMIFFKLDKIPNKGYNGQWM